MAQRSGAIEEGKENLGTRDCVAPAPSSLSLSTVEGIVNPFPDGKKRAIEDGTLWRLKVTAILRSSKGSENSKVDDGVKIVNSGKRRRVPDWHSLHGHYHPKSFIGSNSSGALYVEEWSSPNSMIA